MADRKRAGFDPLRRFFRDKLVRAVDEVVGRYHYEQLDRLRVEVDQLREELRLDREAVAKLVADLEHHFRRDLAAAAERAAAASSAEFAQAAREAVSSGFAVNQPAAFAAELRRAGEILSQSGGGSGDEAATAAALAAVTAALRGVRGDGARVAEPPPVVPIESLAPAPAARRPPTTPADRARASGATRAPAPLPEPPLAIESAGGIAGSWMVYQRMVAAGVGPASLDVLLKRPSADTARPPAPKTPPPPPPPPAPPAPPQPGAQAAVDIRTLIYKGERARQRAQELREAARRASGDDLRAIIDEVCDLVVLAIEPES